MDRCRRWTTSDGTALFTARARALRPAFTETPAIVELCARLDNLPLALELAAARIPIFSPEQLLERLGDGVELKGGRDADPRQQTWTRRSAGRTTSSRRKSGGCSRGLRCSSGGCTYEAAEAVCAADADTLQSLIDKSLVRSREAAGRDAVLDAGDDPRVRGQASSKRPARPTP